VRLLAVAQGHLLVELDGRICCDCATADRKVFSLGAACTCVTVFDWVHAPCAKTLVEITATSYASTRYCCPKNHKHRARDVQWNATSNEGERKYASISFSFLLRYFCPNDMHLFPGLNGDNRLTSKPGVVDVLFPMNNSRSQGKADSSLTHSITPGVLKATRIAEASSQRP